jgi:hypothetical protein
MKFTAEDFIFGNVYGDGVRMVAEKSAEVANAKIQKWVAESDIAETLDYARRMREANATLRAALVALEVRIENAPIAYGTPDERGWHFHSKVNPDYKPTHRTRLVDIEEVK